MKQEPIPDVADEYDKAYEQGKRDERQRIWKALKSKWHGDMGPAHILVTDLEAEIKP